MLVYRNGIEIGRAKVAIRQPELPLGTHAFIMMDGQSKGVSPIADGKPAHRWVAVGIPGHADADRQPLDPAHAERVKAPPQFGAAVYGILAPGATLIVTDAPVLEHTTAVALNVLNADQPVAD